MSGEGGRRGDLSEILETRDGTTTLVLGTANHDAACRRLAGAATDPGYRVRLAADEPASVSATNTDDQYETGVYDGLSLPDAGIAVADTIANLAHDDVTLDPGELVVCVDGVPLPASEAGRKRLFQFLNAVTRRVQDADGHCHAHLAVTPGSRVAALVEPLFEYVVDATDD